MSRKPKSWPSVCHVLETGQSVSIEGSKPTLLSMPLSEGMQRTRQRAMERSRRKERLRMLAAWQAEEIRQKGKAKKLKASTKKANHRPFKAKPVLTQREIDLGRWMRLRARVLAKYGRKCMRCASEDEPIHVDHIRPRSRFPNLVYDFNNLQVLCRACNEEKSDRFIVDYRPDRLIASRAKPKSNAKVRQLEEQTFIELQTVMIEFDAAWSARL